jgi:hypothetical protein
MESHDVASIDSQALPGVALRSPQLYVTAITRSFKSSESAKEGH